jgi:site-specific recombinase XerD
VPLGQTGYAVLAGLPTPHEGQVWPAGNFRTSFQNAVTAAKLNSPFKFHDCRHHFASWYVMDGGNLQVLQKILGHTSLTMTMKYAHLSPDYLRADVAKVEAARERRRNGTVEEVSDPRAQDRGMRV